MRNANDYRNLRYKKRARVYRGHEGPKGEFWFLALILVAVVIAFRVDGAAIDDCNGRTTCINEVLP